MKRLVWVAAAAAVSSAAGCFGGVFADDYRTCSSDPDCHNGERCLMTGTGAVCVTSQDSRCSSNANCPGGTVCGTDGACRTVCDGSATLPCLVGQACRDAVCVGSDARHDPSGTAGGTGSGGAGGAGAAGGTGGAGGGVGGAAGSSGASGSSGSGAGAGSSGSGGASGSSGSGGGITCSAEGQCPGGHCVVGSPPTCHKSCAAAADCLTTEVCDAWETVAGGSAPFVCVDPAGTQQEGDACRKDSHCQGGTDCKNGVYCSKPCKTTGDCSNTCAVDSGRCAPLCAPPSAKEYCLAIGGSCKWANTPGGTGYLCLP